MSERFTYKGKKYITDNYGNISEDCLFGSKVGKIGKDGNFEIQTGSIAKEEGRIDSWSGNVYEKGILGGDKEKVGEKKACLLSTACVAARGLPDDCMELMTLRNFRRDHLEGTPRGNDILQEYQVIGSQILSWLDGRTDRQILYDDLYRRLVRETVYLIHAEKIEEAIYHYQSIVREYQTMTITSYDNDDY